MSDQVIELHCGAHAEVKLVDAGDVVQLVLGTDRISRTWRAYAFFMSFGLLLNIFGLIGYYYLSEQGKPFASDSVLALNYTATVVCFLLVLLLAKLMRTTRRCSWETKISKETGRLESVSVHEWVGLDRNDWAVRRLVVPGNPIGGVTKDTHVLLVQTFDEKTVIPVLASVSSEFDRVFDTVLKISGQPELETLTLNNKISATGNVRFQVGSSGILNTVAVN